MIAFSTKNKRLSTLFKVLSSILFWIALWQIIYLLINNDILVASPVLVFNRILEIIFEEEFWGVLFFSLLRMFLGFLLAVFFGIILSILTARFEIIDIIMSPILLVIKTTPVISFIVLALVFINSTYVPIFISFLMVVPIVWSSIRQGIKETDIKLIEMSNVFRLSRYEVIKKIYMHYIMPYFIVALKTGLGFAWKSSITAEVISNARHSIGSKIYEAKIYMETVDLFSWTIIIIILSFILEKILIKFLSKLH